MAHLQGVGTEKAVESIIHVDLSHVKSATTFADIIAYPNSSLQPAIAKAIVDRKGSGVCLFWMV